MEHMGSSDKIRAERLSWRTDAVARARTGIEEAREKNVAPEELLTNLSKLISHAEEFGLSTEENDLLSGGLRYLAKKLETHSASESPETPHESPAQRIRGLGNYVVGEVQNSDSAGLRLTVGKGKGETSIHPE